VKEVLQAPYLRYVDDLALFHDEPAVLARWRSRISGYLARRRLSLHPRKTFVAPTAAPATFLGLVLLPGGRRRLPEENVRRFHNRLRGLRDRYHAGTAELERAERHIRSWIAHAAHADTWRLRTAIFRDAAFYPSRRPGRSPCASCAAAPGTTTRETCARRTATTTHRTNRNNNLGFRVARTPRRRSRRLYGDGGRAEVCPGPVMMSGFPREAGAAPVLAGIGDGRRDPLIWRRALLVRRNRWARLRLTDPDPFGAHEIFC
jgi:hypothetical protein